MVYLPNDISSTPSPAQMSSEETHPQYQLRKLSQSSQSPYQFSTTDPQQKRTPQPPVQRLPSGPSESRQASVTLSPRPDTVIALGAKSPSRNSSLEIGAGGLGSAQSDHPTGTHVRTSDFSQGLTIDLSGSGTLSQIPDDTTATFNQNYWNGLLGSLHYRDGQMSPPSPSTMETHTDSMTGDWIPSSASQMSGDDAMLGSQSRDTSFSQPSSQQQSIQPNSQMERTMSSNGVALDPHSSQASRLTSPAPVQPVTQRKPSADEEAQRRQAEVQHANRARSASQPSSFSGRRPGALSLSIPSQGATSSFAQLGSAFSPLPTPNPQSGNSSQSNSERSQQAVPAPLVGQQQHIQQIFFDTPAGTDPSSVFNISDQGDYFMNVGVPPLNLADYQNIANVILNDPSTTSNKARYGYRLPASQPSSPVRSGYPPGMAPFHVPSTTTHGARPRGITVSGMSAFPQTILETTSEAAAAPTTPVRSRQPSHSAAPQTHSAGSNMSPFPLTTINSPVNGNPIHHSFSTGDPSTPIPETHNQQMQPQMQHAHLATPSHMPVSPFQTLSANLSPKIRLDSSAASLHHSPVHEISMMQHAAGGGLNVDALNQSLANLPGANPASSQLASVQSTPRQDSSGPSVGGTPAGVMHGPTSSQSSSAGFAGTHVGLLAPQAQHFNGGGGENLASGAITPDLSQQVQEKLTFLESLAKSVDAAKGAILRGDGSTANNLISDVGNAILEKALHQPMEEAPASAISLSVPMMEGVLASTTPGPSSIAPSKQPSEEGSALMSSELLQAPFEISRPTSSKRSAPESPATEGIMMTNTKHMRLDHVTGDSNGGGMAVEHPFTPQESLPSRPSAPTHAHSFPSNHPSTSQFSFTGAADNGGAGAPFAALSVQPHVPHVPSPLSGNPLSAPQFTFNSQNMQNLPQWPPGDPRLVTGLAYQGNATTQAVPEIPQNQMDGSSVAGGSRSRRNSLVDNRLLGSRPHALTNIAHAHDIKSASTSALPNLSHCSPLDADDMDEDDGNDSDNDGADRSSRSRRPSENAAPAGTLVPPPDLVSDEIRQQLDVILHAFLNKVCSDLEYHDAKGELLHQALMPKKMAKLEESKDFRPFKFRIQAFTNAFQEELQRLGVLDETLSSKKIKSYLWTQPLISRFNEDGKKSKSKGNHIWSVDARKLPDGSWMFREFKRKIAPDPPQQAFFGSMFSWSARVWDPQASTTDLEVEFSSPEGTLPRWLSWTGNVLSGMPQEGDEGGVVEAVARFMDSSGQMHELSRKFMVEALPLDDLGTLAPSDVHPTGTRPGSPSGSKLSLSQHHLSEGTSVLSTGGFDGSSFPINVDYIPMPVEQQILLGSGGPVLSRLQMASQPVGPSFSAQSSPDLAYPPSDPQLSFGSAVDANMGAAMPDSTALQHQQLTFQPGPPSGIGESQPELFMRQPPHHPA